MSLSWCRSRQICAVEAALGLAHQRGNTVTLSYRKEAFSRIKERNAQRVAESMKSGKVRVIFNSQPLEILPRAVRLEVAGTTREIANDYVWVFAGGLHAPETATVSPRGRPDVSRVGVRRSEGGTPSQ